MNKAELRKLFREKRTQIRECDIENLSIEISLRFFENFDLADVGTLHCFLPAVSKKEINTWHIIEGIRVKYPETRIVVPHCIDHEEMVGRCLEAETLLTENKWGIPEPMDGEEVDPMEIDVVIVPLLAYDQKGNRIGYGKGFYDRFLSRCRKDVFKIGVSCFEPVENIDDADIYDVPVNAAVCPEHVYYFEVI
jgi:5-formyltetrahydrofolate cyclo-ligase